MVRMCPSLSGPSEVSASVRYSRRPTCPDTSVGGRMPTPPPARHRKSHSLGNKSVLLKTHAHTHTHSCAHTHALMYTYTYTLQTVFYSTCHQSTHTHPH